MSSAKTARWLDLIAFLLYRRYPVSRDEIFESVHGYVEEEAGPGKGTETARRMFERDKDELRSLGIDIETVDLPEAAGDEPATGYRLKASGFYLPYLELEESPRGREYPRLTRVQVSQEDLRILDQATRIVADRVESPLGRAAASARRKLEFDLPLPVSTVERVLSAPLGNDGEKALETLQRAVEERIAVRCRYYSIGRDREESRVLEPYGLFFNWSRWYCVARARDREHARVFRLDRMRDVVMEKGKAARFELPAGFTIQSYLGRSPWELSGADPVTVRVRFGFPESRWVQAQGIGQAVEPLLDDGGAIVEFEVQDEGPFLRWLLTFRRQAVIVQPEQMALKLDELRGRIAAIYDRPADQGGAA